MTDKLQFRYLKENEIEVYPKIVKEKGCMVLLYKDARCDMNILDETVGPMNWQRKHLRDNANCVVSIWDEKKEQWISKEDTGVESFAEKAKGLASDSFKRACFNWGIGRELYTAPFIWINLNENETYNYKKNGKVVWNLDKKVKFNVYHIKTVKGHIVELGIEDQNNNKRFRWIDKEYKAKQEKKEE